MSDSPSDEDRAAYRLRISDGCVQAIHAAGKVEGAEGSMVDLSMALNGVADAVAWLLVEALPDHPTDRRELADTVRKQIIMTANRFAERRAAGDWDSWGMTEIGRPN